MKELLNDEVNSVVGGIICYCKASVPVVTYNMHYESFKSGKEQCKYVCCCLFGNGEYSHWKLGRLSMWRKCQVAR